MHIEAQRGSFTISTDPARLDLDAIHSFLSRSYWATGIPRSVVERSIRGSVCFGVYAGAQQVGFARVNHRRDFTSFHSASSSSSVARPISRPRSSASFSTFSNRFVNLRFARSSA